MSLIEAPEGMRGSSEGDLANRSGNAQDLGGRAAVPGGDAAGGGAGAVAYGGVRARGAHAAAVLVLEAAQAHGAGSAADVLAADDGAVAGAGGAADRGVYRERGLGGRAPGGGAAVPAALHAGRHPAAGGDGRAARHAVRPGHDGLAAARFRGLRGCALRAPGGGLPRPPVQLAALHGLCAHARQPGRHAPGGDADRRKPRPEGRPGWVRVDSVHQGDLDKVKGVYHINAVDEVTQYQFTGCVERISERYLLPVLERLLASFPFVVHGFHSDNGSEYINYQVAELLEKLRVEEFTKSRPRRSNDNALAESKNGSVIRKQFGYGHIPGRHAERLDRFHREVLDPYLNYHRPCLFPRVETDAKGKRRKAYRQADIRMPYERLKALPEAA